MSPERLVYFNVNEEAKVYDRHDAVEPALKVLEEFPNDIVLIAYEGSHAAKTMQEDLES